MAAQGGEVTTPELRRLLAITLPAYAAAAPSQPAALREAQQALHVQLASAAEAAVAAAEGARGRRGLYAAAALAAVIDPFPPHVRLCRRALCATELGGLAQHPCAGLLAAR